MTPVSRAVFLAAGIFILHGVNWSFNVDDPPMYWKGTESATFNINTGMPFFYQNEAIDGATKWNGHSRWSFYFGSTTQASYFTVGDDSNTFDYVAFPEEPLTAAFTRPTTDFYDPTDVIEVDSALNSVISWSDTGSPGPQDVDVQTVAVHEFGHWLVLQHSDDPFSVMQDVSPGEVRRFPSLDDIDGIRFLYPAGGVAGGGRICNKIGACTICHEERSVSMVTGLRKRQIESLDFEEIQTLMFRKPQSRALLFAIISHLPELEHIALNYEEEVTRAWEPLTDEWLPGLFWLSEDVARGQNLVLTERRALALSRGIAVVRKYSSRHLRRDLDRTQRFLRTHVGRTLEEMRSELFEEYSQSARPPTLEE